MNKSYFAIKLVPAKPTTDGDPYIAAKVLFPSLEKARLMANLLDHLGEYPEKIRDAAFDVFGIYENPEVYVTPVGNVMYRLTEIEEVLVESNYESKDE